MPHSPSRLLTKLSVLLVLAVLFLLSDSIAAEEIDFARDIQPILKAHCYECHGAETREAGLRLDRRADALAGGDSGQVIVPEKPADSLLLRLVSGEDENRVMPPDGEPLTSEQIELLRQWIQQGASWPSGLDPQRDPIGHWAYLPLDPSLSEGDIKHETGHPIDKFVQAKLAQHNISASPHADRHTLIKRLYYDLLGLPPSVEAVDAFVQDTRENAYEILVDELLASPHFGERWGRHWLDMARYADSDGYEKDRPRYNAWKYRDWVIQAINDDMPFDQFTIEQLAGDLLPNPTDDQVLATAFHRQTLTNTEGGTDQEEFRVAAIFDRVETVGTVWLGLTVGCARCHSHKYDQISHREYYQLFAFLNNGDEQTRDVHTSETSWQNYLSQQAAYEAKLSELQAPLEARKDILHSGFEHWLSETQARFDRVQDLEMQTPALTLQSVTSTGGATLSRLDDGSILSVGNRSTQDVYELVYTISEPIVDESAIAGIRLEALTDDSLPGNGPGLSGQGNFVLSEITVDLTTANAETRLGFRTASADFSQKDFEVAQAIDGLENTKGWAVAPNYGKPHSASFYFEAPIAGSASDSKLKIRLSQQYDTSIHTLGRFRVSFISSEQAQLAELPENVQKALSLKIENRDETQQLALLEHFFSLDEEYRKLANMIDQHEKQVPFKPEMTVRVIQERFKDARTTHIMKRGDFLQPLGPVEANTLESLPPLSASDGAAPSRLDLARWLVSGDNPLPPRVVVNQVWAKLFGQGLVSTINDFGVRGEPPTHPRLLDHLAQEFIESGWSRKQLIKQIVMSQAYQQSSAHREELIDIDPTNRLLARQNRFRVEAEIIRDLYLTASGLLEPRIGGPSVFPPLPPGIEELSYANNFKWGNSDWNTRADNPHAVPPKDDIHRRGMYTFFKRTAAHPNLITFDCPDSNTTCVDRGASNTPLQALQTLNNQTFFEASRAMANRVLKDQTLTDNSARLEKLFRLCLVRNPSADEMITLEALLNDSQVHFEDTPEAALSLNGSEIDNPATTAAWITLARVVMNLDEFMTRE